jgi:hypothetical protein
MLGHCEGGGGGAEKSNACYSVDDDGVGEHVRWLFGEWLVYAIDLQEVRKSIPAVMKRRMRW